MTKGRQENNEANTDGRIAEGQVSQVSGGATGSRKGRYSEKGRRGAAQAAMAAH